VVIRRAEPGDLDAIRRIHADALCREAGVEPDEVALVDSLLEDGDVVPALSLVALRNGEPVGHVVCSTAWVGETTVVGLGPIGVAPEHQGGGVGSALMHAVLAAADALAMPLVGLLGSVEYYARFGFVPATTLGIEPPDRAWQSYFQVRTLTAYDRRIVGTFRYAPAFGRG
jgi:putative acetyltransferase